MVTSKIIILLLYSVSISILILSAPRGQQSAISRYRPIRRGCRHPLSSGEVEVRDDFSLLDFNFSLVLSERAEFTTDLGIVCRKAGQRGKLPGIIFVYDAGNQGNGSRKSSCFRRVLTRAPASPASFDVFPKAKKSSHF